MAESGVTAGAGKSSIGNNLRRAAIHRLEEEILVSGKRPTRSAIDMETFIYSKTDNKEEYLLFMARFIHYVKTGVKYQNPYQ